MANDNPTVILDIRRINTDRPQFIDVMGSNQSLYSYKYRGGNHADQNGRIEHKVNQGVAMITLELEAYTDNCYQITSVYFTNHNNQLSSEKLTDRKWKITNKCTDEIDAHYYVIITDTGRSDASHKAVTLLCDPAIRNLPR